MTPTETIEILRHYSDWLQGEVESLLPVPDMVKCVNALDSACAMIERIGAVETALREIAWSNDSAWQADRARAALGELK